MSITAKDLTEALKTGQDIIILVNGEYYVWSPDEEEEEK